MIDLHSHLLPAIDDGSRSVEQSLETLERLAADGVTAVVLTPHARASRLGAAPEVALARRDAAFAELVARAPARPALHLGFEILLDEPLPPLATGDRRLSLAGSRYYLVEFPLAVAAELTTSVLERIAQAGVVPLVAHPERYETCDARMVRAWREVGARIQVDATALTRPGPRGAKARELLRLGLVDLAAADNHGDRKTLLTARRYLEAHGDADAAERLTASVPRAVVDDRELGEPPVVNLREGVVERMFKLLG